MPHGPTDTGWEGSLPDELFNLYTLECANKNDTEVCGEDCSLTVPTPYVSRLGGAHILAVMYNWQVLTHACLDPDHPLHHLFFCSIACLANWSARAKAENEAEEKAEEMRG